MARYIDADALIEMLNNKAKTDLEMGLYNHGALTQSFINFVERQPTADVAPKNEVAVEIFAGVRKCFYEVSCDVVTQLNNARQNEDMRLINTLTAVDDALRNVRMLIADFERKYT